jgi:hypothetical protein
VTDLNTEIKVKITRKQLKRLIKEMSDNYSDHPANIPIGIIEKAREIEFGIIIDISQINLGTEGRYPVYEVIFGEAELDKDDVGISVVEGFIDHPSRGVHLYSSNESTIDRNDNIMNLGVSNIDLIRPKPDDDYHQ